MAQDVAESVAPAPPLRFNFARHLLEVNQGRAARPAYIDDRTTLSYGGLEERVRRCAAGLLALGVRREERVFLLMHDSVDWPVSFLGALYAGVVPVAVNTLLTADDYAYMLAHSRAQAALVSAPLLPVLQAAMGKGTHELKHVLVSVSGAAPAGTRSFDEWLGAQAPLASAADTAADEIAFWLYSSGSTGRPKGTVHRHASPYWTAELYGKPVLGLREGDVTFSAAKLFFAYGLGNGLSFPLSAGSTVVLMAERATPEACFKRLTQHRATVFFGAPTGYAAMLASPQLPSLSDVALRLCSSAGEALPRQIGERFTERYGCAIIDGIGSTEMLHIFISNRPGDVRYGTTGKPVPGYEVEIRDDSGRPIEQAEQVGDLYIKGPSGALMYWTDQGRSSDTFQGCWTRSGDKYYRDADGYYVYAGRADDMFKVSGQYVSPFEVEATLVQHPAVLEAALISVPGADELTRSKAFVVLKEPFRATDALADELKQFVKTRLAPHKYPRSLEFLTELPKTATGKIQRFRLRERESDKRR
jgi:benzoate-CoA ligase